MIELFDPHSNEWLLNKFNFYKILREKENAYFSEKYQMYIITRYDDIVFALNNPDIFSSAKGNLIVESPHRFNNTLGASDNPVHDIFKNIVKEAYSKKNIERVAGCLTTYAKPLLSEKNEINISEVIEHLSAWTTAEILNIPYDKEKIKNLVFDIQRTSPNAVQHSPNDHASLQLKNILFFLALTNKKTPATGPGIYHEFINNNPKDLNITSLFTGPTLSGASSLTGGLQFLILDLYREGLVDEVFKDRSLIPNAVNESLRFNASTGRFSRTVLKETTLHGINLKPGDRVAVCLESGNRDPSKFTNPDVFDLNRDTSGHLAFGHGLHSCIALAISKSLLTEFLSVVFDYFGKYKIITPDGELKYVMTASGNDDMINNIHIAKDSQ
jgi:cytochrome P450